MADSDFLADVPEPDADLAQSPRSTLAQAQFHSRPIGSTLESLDLRADPDAQAIVTDFVDFTEHLPSDMLRSLTLIGKLDREHAHASAIVHQLTTLLGRLPSVPVEERPRPDVLRAEIAKYMTRGLSARNFAFAEARRMRDNLSRYHHRASTILAKLRDMQINFPSPEEQQQNSAAATAAKASQQSRSKFLKSDKARRRQVPRITFPGEVLAPWELEFEDQDSEDENGAEWPASEDEKLEMPVPTPRTIKPARPLSATTPSSRRWGGREKATRGGGGGRGGRPRTQKGGRRPVPIIAARPLADGFETDDHVPPSPLQQQQQQPQQHDGDTAVTPVTPSGAGPSPVIKLRMPPLKPPPSDAKPGSIDAPWLQLTPYELAKLRKRMKKNSVWAPSETMVARELKMLGRGLEAYREAKKQAEVEGREFEAPMVPDADSPGTIRADAGGDDIPTSNRGMRLNEAKKIKREALAKLAAEEGGATIKPPRELAPAPPPVLDGGVQREGEAKGQKPARPRANKRKRKGEGDNIDGKRVKRETPAPLSGGVNANSSANPSPILTSSAIMSPGTATSAIAPPLPLPTPILPPVAHRWQNTLSGASSKASSVSPPPSIDTASVVTAPEHQPPPPPPPRLPRTPVPPPLNTNFRSRSSISANGTNVDTASSDTAGSRRREMRGKSLHISPPSPTLVLGPGPPSSRSTPVPDSATSLRRPASSRISPQPSLASERPRRASTARNTPAPDSAISAKPQSATISRVRRKPVPGIVGAGKSAVGKRKVAPKRRQKKDKDQPTVEDAVDEEEEVDPDEQRYCLCNGVSFGTMILCENENCKPEWFHLECVDLDQIPARTTKWYCPDCRKALGLGEKGQVDARGMKS